MENQTGKINYYDVPALSNSAMGRLNPAQGGSLKKYQLWLEEDKERKELKYFERGRLLHTAILEPELYKVEDIERPSDTICTLVESVFEEFGAVRAVLPDPLNLDHKMLYLQVFNNIQKRAEELNYGQKWKPDTVFEKVRKEGSEYLEFLRSASDKLVITKKDKEIIDGCYFALQKHPEAQRMLFQEESNKEYEIYETFEDVQMKSKLDIHKVDDNVITVRELKSTSMPVTLFPFSFTKFRYYRQSAVYGRMAAMEYYRLYNKPAARVVHEYIVVEMSPPHEVMVYTIHPDWIAYGAREMEKIVDYYKTGIDIFPPTVLTMREDGYPRGDSALLNIRP
jgi:hypothetical protein